jgi:hypothetical protein
MSSVTAVKQSVPQLPPMPVQQGPTQVLATSRPSLVTTVLKNAAIFGGIGAIAGAALSFTALPFIGVLSAPIAAAIGGAVGVLAGVVKGIFQHRKETNALPPVSQGPGTLPPGVLLPPPLPPGVPG